MRKNHHISQPKRKTVNAIHLRYHQIHRQIRLPPRLQRIHTVRSCTLRQHLAVYRICLPFQTNQIDFPLVSRKEGVLKQEELLGSLETDNEQDWIIK